MKWMLFGFLFLLLPSAMAHTLKIDGTMGVLIHIEPDDEPVMNESATIFIDIKDSSSRFNFTECDCHVSIIRDETVEHSFPITKTTSLYSYMFQKPGTYHIRVFGNGAHTFETSFEYYVRPELHAQSISHPVNPLVALVPFAALFAGMVILLMFLLPRGAE